MTDPKQTDAIEAAIDAAEYEWPYDSDMKTLREVVRAAIAAYRDAEIEALRAQICNCDEESGQHLPGCDVTLREIIEAMRDQIKELENDLERERMRLAACSTAALGYFEEPCLDDYRSAALDDVLQLRAKLSDCQATLRKRGHEADCPAVDRCVACGGGINGIRHNPRAPTTLGIDIHEFQPGPCSDSCGFERCVGVE